MKRIYNYLMGNGKTKLAYFFVFLVLLVFGIFGYFFYPGYQSKSEQYPEENVSKEEWGCRSSDDLCQGKQNGTQCTTGIWCDDEGKECGGNSCVGMGMGKCINDRCASLCENCPLYAPPPPGWCDDGTIVGGDDIYNSEEVCYCPGPPKCI